MTELHILLPPGEQMQVGDEYYHHVAGWMPCRNLSRATLYVEDVTGTPVRRKIRSEILRRQIANDVFFQIKGDQGNESML
jgi:hypothetical protein